MKTAPSVIRLLSSEDARHEERLAAATITPGMLIMLTSLDKVQAHNVAGGACAKLFALEDALQGKTISQNYASGDVVGYHVGVPGDHIYAFLADGEEASIGSLLTSNGDGSLRVVTASDVAIAFALEAVDLSVSSNTTKGRIRVELI